MKTLQEIDPEHPDIEKLTKKIKGENKKQDIYDQFADDQIDFCEFEERVMQKFTKPGVGKNKRFPAFKKDKLNQTTLITRDNIKRLSGFEDVEEEKQHDVGMISMADILADIENEKDVPLLETEEK